MEDRSYAHTKDGEPPFAWQDLRQHLEAVAALAAGFAAAFGSESWGHLAGLWHDLGKYRQRFQDYLLGPARARSGGDHAAAGALLAQKLGKGGAAWVALALPIAGHHAGLANLSGDQEGRPLLDRLNETEETLDEALQSAPGDLVDHALPSVPDRFASIPRNRQDRQRRRRRFELWIRFLFSALVDADFLDTEFFYKGAIRADAASALASIASLSEALDEHVDRLAAGAEPTPVNRMRAEVLAAARRAASQSPGLFSMSVPTGGGKTLASMSFALRHAERHGLRRVIVVVPLTTIIEQNAGVYRDAFGPWRDSLIEHHSNLDPENETPRNKLASENWEAPAVITTAVQFFESLFSNRSSRCRKVHNIARSVIVLDEAQTLPIEFLAPILETLDDLASNYGCSIVFSTATQPALNTRPAFPEGLRGVREMIPDPAELAGRIRRFEPQWPELDAPPLSWEEIAERLQDIHQVLAVVHLRKDARELARLLPPEGRFHLSALMCGAHRAAVMERIRRALRKGRPCRLVSTQLIEAGVDIDFPAVHRALGGLDSLLQAAGRCNREGELDKGELVIFRAPTQPPVGTLRKGLQATETILRLHRGELDLFDPEITSEFFRQLYFQTDRDARGIRALQSDLCFASVAKRFRLIDDYSRPVVVPWGEGPQRLERLRDEGPNRETLRALQPFVVNLPPRQLLELEELRCLELVHDTIYCLSPDADVYDEEFGLVFEADDLPGRTTLMV